MNAYSEVINRIFGAGIVEMRPVYGGDASTACVLTLSDGRKLFLKENSAANAGSFKAEEKGLSAMRKTGSVRVPRVWETGITGNRSYLIMEYLEAGPRKKDYWESFGQELAGMHRADTSEWTPGGRYGFTEDNYIGAGRQMNEIRPDWIGFFRDCRLEAQFRKAQMYFEPSDRKAMQSLLDHLDLYLVEPPYPSLLHGDLWGGNYVTGPDGYAWLIDPAVYVGHAEADLAMTELFGGFAPAFYDACREAGGILPGYSDRRDLYNLYHLLNHLNLFGRSYYGEVLRIIRRYR